MITRSGIHFIAVELVPGTELDPVETNYIRQYWDHFGSKDNLAFEVQGLPQFALQNAYKLREEGLLESSE